MLYLYDDLRARALEPYALTRPVSELRAGARLIRHRWEHALGRTAAGLIVAPHLSDFEELDAPSAVSGELPAGSIVANSRCVVALERAPDAAVWGCEDRVAAVRIDRPVAAASFADGTLDLEALGPSQRRVVELRGRWIEAAWELVGQLRAQLLEDVAELGLRMGKLRPEHSIILGAHPVYVEHGAHIEPQVCFDTREGPVLVRRDATIHAFSRLTGPCFIGEGSTVLGARIASSSIGDWCKVGGEVSSSIFLGHANKGHEGFVGHSYLGRWVNLGAGTTTSNLKNTYGPVTVRTAQGEESTGLQFLGTLFGDHVKTAIGTRLTTGSIVGAGASVFGAAMPSKRVAAFSWGDGTGPPYRAEKFIEVAERVMARRHVPLTDRMRRQLAASFARGTTATGGATASGLEGAAT